MSLSQIEKELQSLSKDSHLMNVYDRWSKLDGLSKKWKGFGGLDDTEATTLHAKLRVADRIRNIEDDRIAKKAYELATKSGVIQEYTNDTLCGAKVIARTEDGSPEWHRARRFGLGGSSIAGALGLHWKSMPGSPKMMEEEEIEEKWIDMAVEKSADLTPEEISSNNPQTGAAYRGHLWEPALLVHYAAITGKKVAVTKATWSSDISFQRVNLDGLIISPKTGKVEGILECKTALRKWLWNDGVPVGYRAQVAWYLHCFELDYADVIVRFEDGDMEIHRIEATDTIADSSDTLTIDKYVNILGQRWDILTDRVNNIPNLWNISKPLIADRANLNKLGLNPCEEISSSQAKDILSGNIVSIVEEAPFPRMPDRFNKVIGAEICNNLSPIKSIISTDANPLLYPVEKVANYSTLASSSDIMREVSESNTIYAINSATKKTILENNDLENGIDVINLSSLKRSSEMRPNAPDFNNVEEAVNWLENNVSK